MIPTGYRTIFEVLKFLESAGKSLDDLQTALLNGELPLFVVRDERVGRVPLEDVQAIRGQDIGKWTAKVLYPNSIAVEHAHFVNERLVIFEEDLNRWLGIERRTGAPGRPTVERSVMRRRDRSWQASFRHWR